MTPDAVAYIRPIDWGVNRILMIIAEWPDA